ncbi:MAG: hypothetical protein ACMG55_05405 [Microcoleus sp.]
MKIFRGFILGVCSLFFSLCVSIILTYSLLSMTLLHPGTVKGWLRDSNTYAKVTDALIIPQLSQSLATTSPSQALISGDVVKTAAKASLTPTFIQTSSETILDAVYAWLDSAKPAITYSISTKPVITAFYDSLHSQIVAKLQALPKCFSYAQSSESITSATCLPRTITASAAADELITQMQASGPLGGDKITEASFSTGQPSSLTSTATKNIPDFVSYAWFANLIAWPFAVFTAFVIILNRRWAGGIAVGTAVLVPGLIMAVVATIALVNSPNLDIQNMPGLPPELNGLMNGLIKVAVPSMAHSAQFIGLIAGGVGVAFIGLGLLWRHLHKKRQANSGHYQAGADESSKDAPLENLETPIIVAPQPIVVHDLMETDTQPSSDSV